MYKDQFKNYCHLVTKDVVFLLPTLTKLCFNLVPFIVLQLQ